MALRASSPLRGLPRRCTSYIRRSFSARNCSLRSSSRLLSAVVSAFACTSNSFDGNCHFNGNLLCFGGHLRASHARPFQNVDSLLLALSLHDHARKMVGRKLAELRKLYWPRSEIMHSPFACSPPHTHTTCANARGNAENGRPPERVSRSFGVLRLVSPRRTRLRSRAPRTVKQKRASVPWLCAAVCMAPCMQGARRPRRAPGRRWRTPVPAAAEHLPGTCTLYYGTCIKNVRFLHMNSEGIVRTRLHVL